jgi:pSer/pThr/pTyr-binding forkhead associated (FHA) protein
VKKVPFCFTRAKPRYQSSNTDYSTLVGLQLALRNLTNEQEFTKVPDLLKLECIEGPNQGSSYSKPGAVLTVGRTNKSKIHILDDSISEKHGLLEWDGSAWLVQDVGSSNGTTVNGNLLEADGRPGSLDQYAKPYFIVL